MKSQNDKIKYYLSKFETSVLKHDEYSLKDSDAANRYYDASIKALNQLNRFGDDGLSALATLLDHKSRIVRVTTASYLIHRYTNKAKMVLIEAANEERTTGGLAIVTLKRWERGRYLDLASGREVEVH